MLRAKYVGQVFYFFLTSFLFTFLGCNQSVSNPPPQLSYGESVRVFSGNLDSYEGGASELVAAPMPWWPSEYLGLGSLKANGQFNFELPKTPSLDPSGTLSYLLFDFFSLTCKDLPLPLPNGDALVLPVLALVAKQGDMEVGSLVEATTSIAQWFGNINSPASLKGGDSLGLRVYSESKASVKTDCFMATDETTQVSVSLDLNFQQGWNLVVIEAKVVDSLGNTNKASVETRVLPKEVKWFYNANDYGPTTCIETVTIPDEGLANAIRIQIGKDFSDDICLEDMQNLSYLDAGYLEPYTISDITGLELASNLDRLNLSYNNISNISALSGLVKLRDLSLSFNPISDISPLSGLVNLTSLDMVADLISDLGALANLKNLEFLYLDGNTISKIDGLSELDQLQFLNLGYNTISDISPLAGLINLETLYLFGNSISDLRGLTNLDHLISLYLNYNKISDLSPLTKLVNLTELELMENSITDISDLSGLVNMQALYLDGNSISNISPLSALTNLTFVQITSNQISDLGPLTSLEKLAGIYLGNNNISDLSPLVSMVNLQSLYLNSNHISDIGSLFNLVNLSDLNLSLNPISDISSVANLENLMFLELSDSNISEIVALSTLVNINSLDLRNNLINDIQALVDNPGLGKDDNLLVSGNCLDLSTPPDSSNISTLKKRQFAYFEYSPQKTLGCP